MEKKKMHDEQFRSLCLRMAKGDLSAANELDFALRKPLIGFAIARGVSQSDAEEIAQESFETLYIVCRKNFDINLSYLFGIAINKCADCRRHNNRHGKISVHGDADIAKLAPNEQEPLSIPDSLGQVIEESEIDRLNKCINNLPKEQHTLLKLRFYDQMKLEETRDHMQLRYDNWHVATSTVSARIRQALDALKECLNS